MSATVVVPAALRLDPITACRDGPVPVFAIDSRYEDAELTITRTESLTVAWDVLVGLLEMQRKLAAVERSDVAIPP